MNDRGYAEFTADVSRIEDAVYWANLYQGAGWLDADVRNVYVCNQQTGIGYILVDMDNDASYESSFEMAARLGSIKSDRKI